MTYFKNTRNLLALAFGLLGTLGCVAVMISAWIVSTKLSTTTENLSGQVDEALTVIRERVPPASEQFQAARITIEDIEQSLRNWTLREVGERQLERLKLTERTERLNSTVQQADQWLEMAESTLVLVQQLLSAIRPDEPDESVPVGVLIKELEILRTQLSEVGQFATAVHERTEPGVDESSTRERIGQAIQLAIRAAVTLGLIETGLEKLDGNLAEAQLELRELEDSTLRWIRVITWGVLFLMLWMLAGQYSMCKLAWQRFGNRRSCARKDQRKPERRR